MKNGNFWFHGAECQFENLQTGQIVELVIWGFGTEYGILDSYFFYNYIQTTAKHQKLAMFFGADYKNVAKALDIVEYMGYLERIGTSARQRIATPFSSR